MLMRPAVFPSYNTNKLIYQALLQGFWFFFPLHSKQSCFFFFCFFFLPLSGLQGPQTAAAATNSKTAVIMLSSSKTRLRERLAFTFKNGVKCYQLGGMSCCGSSHLSGIRFNCNKTQSLCNKFINKPLVSVLPFKTLDI